MRDYNEKDVLVSYNTVIEVIQTQRRIGFSEAEINIYHCLTEENEPGFDFDLYDEQYGNSISLYELAEKDCQNIKLHDIAMRLANEITEKTGLNIKINDEIQGPPMEYDEHNEKMWIARMAMQGIDDDY